MRRRLSSANSRTRYSSSPRLSLIVQAQISGDTVIIMYDPLSRKQAGSPVARSYDLSPASRKRNSGKFNIRQDCLLGQGIDKAFGEHSFDRRVPP